jgi:hypothetical protein
MTIAQTDAPRRRKPLRLWPGVVIVILQLLLGLSSPASCPIPRSSYGLFAPPAARWLVILWWLFFSRAALVRALGRRRPDDRRDVRHQAHRGRVDCDWGARDSDSHFLAPPLLGPAFVAWAVATRRLPDRSGASRWSRPSCSRRRVGAGPHRRLHRQPPSRLALAVGEDSRGTARGTIRQRCQGRCRRSGQPRWFRRNCPRSQPATPAAPPGSGSRAGS